MSKAIALLRGINVGGKGRLPMGELKRLLEELGLEAVSTYIQSGNVAFRTDGALPATLAERISEEIEAAHGFRPRVLTLSADELATVIAGNPYPEGDDDPKSVHVFFLAEEPSDPDLDALAELATDSERIALDGKAFYLHAPDGIGRSKLAAKVEKHLGVEATARNWRTVRQLEAMAGTAAD